MRLNLDELDDETVSELGNHLTLEPRNTAVLNSFSEGDVVSVDGRKSTGVIVSRMTETFNFPTDRSGNNVKEEKIEASSDEPVYVVAFHRGSIMAVDEDKLSEDSFDTEKGDSKEEVKELANKAEEASVYGYMRDAHGSIEELREAKREYILEHHEAALSDHEAAQMSYEELVNIRGVDDPHVGFDELPNGWTRKSVLQAWASLGGTFTSCRADMAGEIRSPDRFCAALKDEVLRTELWRNRF